jgi:hypothetical protein
MAERTPFSSLPASSGLHLSKDPWEPLYFLHNDSVKDLYVKGMERYDHAPKNRPCHIYLVIAGAGELTGFIDPRYSCVIRWMAFNRANLELIIVVFLGPLMRE